MRNYQATYIYTTRDGQHYSTIVKHSPDVDIVLGDILQRSRRACWEAVMAEDVFAPMGATLGHLGVSDNGRVIHTQKSATKNPVETPTFEGEGLSVHYQQNTPQQVTFHWVNNNGEPVAETAYLQDLAAGWRTGFDRENRLPVPAVETIPLLGADRLINNL